MRKFLIKVKQTKSFSESKVLFNIKFILSELSPGVIIPVNNLVGSLNALVMNYFKHKCLLIL